MSAAEAVDVRTGELVPVVAVPFALTEYLGNLSGKKALEEQNALSAAYDAACAGLIGPNDVQKADGRTFKKKSAWRKLARYFNISVEIARVEREVLADGHFLATVTARAVAPWGQRYEEIGACCTDEATGRRVISVADAIATASTRASNRAVSNLIAMGEVSAEEIGDRPAHGTQRGTRATPAAASKDPRDLHMPFGSQKGTRLGDVDSMTLEKALEWAKEKGKFQDFQSAVKAVLTARQIEAEQMDAEQPQRPARVQESESGGTGLPDDDDLPF